MLALIIIGIVVLVFWLIGMIKVGISFNYENHQLTLGVILFGKRIIIDFDKIKQKRQKKVQKPVPDKKLKPEKVKKVKKERTKKEKNVTLSITVDDIIKMIKSTFESLDSTRRGFNFDRFLLHIVVATDDPYNTAVIFGDLNSIIDAVAPICSNRFNCKDLDVWTDVNFKESIPRIDIGFDFTVRLHSFTRRIDILFKLLWIYLTSVFRGIVLKVTDKDEYEYQIEMKKDRKKKLGIVINKIKDMKAEKSSANDTERTN